MGLETILSVLGLGSRLFGALSSGMKVMLIIGVIGSAVVAYGVWRQSLINQGYANAIADIARQDAKAISAAKSARSTYRNCVDNGGMWNTITGECQRR